MTLPVFPSLPGLTLTVVKSPGFKTLIDGAPNGYESRLAQVTNPIWEYQLLFDFLHDFFWGEFDTVSELRTLMGFFNQNYGQAGAFLFTDPDDNYVGPALVSSAPNTPLAQLQLVSDGAGNYYSPVQRTLNGVAFEDVTDLNGSIAVYLDGTLATTGGGADEYTLQGPGLAIPGFSCMGMYLQWGPGASGWLSDHAYTVGQQIVDPAGHIQQVTTAGTSGSTEPNPWNDSAGTTPDGTGTLVWTDQGYYAGPSAPVTAQFNFYFRVRFSSDNQDFEKFLNEGTTGAFVSGQGGGYWTIGGSEAQNGTGQLKLRTARPVPA
jgi:hypothetical protein